jgi:hypothetical protein
LETVQRFIAVSEKELELYYRHVALYGIPQSQNGDQDHSDGRKASFVKMEELDQGKDQNDLSHEVKELDQGKDQNDFSDISDISESDENDSDSEYNANDDGAEDGVSTDETVVISDRNGWVLPNRL